MNGENIQCEIRVLQVISQVGHNGLVSEGPWDGRYIDQSRK